jgi:helix-turn-helix resolvase-like protein
MSKRRPTKRAGAHASARPRAKKSAAPGLIDLVPKAPKRGRGRPTTYDPAFCERVIELGERGKSKAQIARALRVSRKSLYLWMKIHPEFAEAMKEAEFAALAWWEDVGQAGLTIPKFNAALYAFNMKNRFREFYADKVDVAHTQEEPEERQLSDLELARRIAFIFHNGMKETQRQQGQGAAEPVLVDGTAWPIRHA